MVYPDTDNQSSNDIIKTFEIPKVPITKKITITLIWGDFKQAYQVKSITNTTVIKPKSWLSVDVVSKLCLIQGWEIIVLEDELLQNILGLLGKMPLPVI